MTSCDEEKGLPDTEEKKEFPPPTYTERPLGGVFPAEIAKFKQEARPGNQKRKKIVIGVICAVLGLVLVVGLINLGLQLAKDPVVRRSLRFRVDDRELHETVETDHEANTDTFCTESAKAAGCVMYDHEEGLKAYKFTGREICYIMQESEREARQAKRMAKSLEEEDEGSLQRARRGENMKMSLDADRTELPALSEKLDDFCGDLEPRWAKLTPAPSNNQTVIVEMIVPTVGAYRVERAGGFLFRIKNRHGGTFTFGIFWGEE